MLNDMPRGFERCPVRPSNVQCPHRPLKASTPRPVVRKSPMPEARQAPDSPTGRSKLSRKIVIFLDVWFFGTLFWTSHFYFYIGFLWWSVDPPPPWEKLVDSDSKNTFFGLPGLQKAPGNHLETIFERIEKSDFFDFGFLYHFSYKLI